MSGAHWLPSHFTSRLESPKIKGKTEERGSRKSDRENRRDFPHTLRVKKENANISQGQGRVSKRKGENICIISRGRVHKLGVVRCPLGFSQLLRLMREVRDSA